jgi:hypothetical protein
MCDSLLGKMYGIQRAMGQNVKSFTPQNYADFSDKILFLFIYLIIIQLFSLFPSFFLRSSFHLFVV